MKYDIITLGSCALTGLKKYLKYKSCYWSYAIEFFLLCCTEGKWFYISFSLFICIISKISCSAVCLLLVIRCMENSPLLAFLFLFLLRNRIEVIGYPGLMIYVRAALNLTSNLSMLSVILSFSKESYLRFLSLNDSSKFLNHVLF